MKNQRTKKLKLTINNQNVPLSNNVNLIRILSQLLTILKLMLRFKKINSQHLLQISQINEIDWLKCHKSCSSKNNDSTMLKRSIRVRNKNSNWRDSNIWNLRVREVLHLIDIRHLTSRELIWTIKLNHKRRCYLNQHKIYLN